jgi:hypothetical protein
VTGAQLEAAHAFAERKAEEDRLDALAGGVWA